MKKSFGYGITQKRSIDYSVADFTMARTITNEVPSFALCIGCGGCSATCSAGALTDFNYRKMQNLIRRGETDAARTEVKKCMLCGKCTLVCPRGVNIRSVILTILKLTK